MKNDKQVWKDIQGYEGLYEVSNYGNVRSLNYNHTNKIKYLKPLKDGSGYYFVRLCKNGIVQNFKVHRLVANAFIENPNNYPQINHKDENKLNNKVSNLEWCDGRYNTRYSQARQVMGIGENGRKTILLEAAIDGELMGFSNGKISNAANGKINKKGSHKYKDFDWYYIPKELYSWLVSMPIIKNDFQQIIIPKNDMIEYR